MQRAANNEQKTTSSKQQLANNKNQNKRPGQELAWSLAVILELNLVETVNELSPEGSSNLLPLVDLCPFLFLSEFVA